MPTDDIEPTDDDPLFTNNLLLLTTFQYQTEIDVRPPGCAPNLCWYYMVNARAPTEQGMRHTDVGVMWVVGLSKRGKRRLISNAVAHLFASSGCKSIFHHSLTNVVHVGSGLTFYFDKVQSGRVIEQPFRAYFSIYCKLIKFLIVILCVMVYIIAFARVITCCAHEYVYELCVKAIQMWPWLCDMLRNQELCDFHTLGHTRSWWWSKLK